MTHLHKIAFLACRITSVYFLANWLGALGSIVSTLFYFPTNMQAVLGSMVSMVFPVAIGVLLWIYSDKLAGFMVKPQDVQETEMISASFDLETVQILAFTIIGVFLIVKAIPSLVSALTVCVILPQHSVGQVWLQTISQLVDSVIQIILGLWLVLGSKGVVNFIKKIRTIGVSDKG